MVDKIDEISVEDHDAFFKKDRINFYCMIGHCITQYQFIEDYLPDVFVSALGGDNRRALHIFSVVRTLEAKLKLITAALTNADEPFQLQWNSIRSEISKAAEARNIIAHSHPTQAGGTVTVIVNEGEPTRVAITSLKK